MTWLAGCEHKVFAMTTAHVAVLIGSDLRAFSTFVKRLDALFVDQEPFDAFISTDGRSLACARRNRLIDRPYVRSVGETPDTAEAILRALGPLPKGVSSHHLHQWWRLKDAWRMMERQERRRNGEAYAWAMRLRSDMRLPAPLELAPASARALRGPSAERALIMRGDWVFWGRREAVRLALEYVDMLPYYHRVGQLKYLELPYRHMVAAGPAALTAGLLNWLKFPRQTSTLTAGFPDASISNTVRIVDHARSHLRELEAFHASGKAARLPASQAFSARDQWWRWNGIPDNEKFFFLHVLNRSLVPINMIDVFNFGRPRGATVSFLGKESGLLIPERIRHSENCTCICDVQR